MKNSGLLTLLLILVSTFSFGQSNSQSFKLEGTNPKVIEWNKTYAENAEIFPFEKNINRLYGVAVNATVQVLDEANYTVRLVLIDENFGEHLIYECYNLLEPVEFVTIDELSEETCILNGNRPYSVMVEVKNAILELKSFSYATGVKAGRDIEKVWKEKKQARDEEKISKINNNLKTRGQHWVAGQTSVSQMSYSERKKLYGQSDFPSGFEYYTGGIISTGFSGESSILKSATASSPYVNEWDWRDRHGKNWISPVTNQGACGSCWAFATTGATEAIANLYFNQQLNLNLSEEDVLSCSGGGTCGGGYPYRALDYIKNYGVVDENTFPYNGLDQPCENKGTNPSEKIRISGRINFGYSEYPREEDILKKLLIEMGPLSSGLYDWSHAIVLVGYKVVKEGDVFFYRDLNLSRYWKTIEAGDPLIGKTVWIFKNSWGINFGDAGYVYVETPITNIEWTHGLVLPVISDIKTYNVVCEDADGDGYYWWGLGPKPANCPGPDLADGDDSDPTLGPLDEYGFCMPLAPASNPVADFTATPNEINAGETVTFTDNSTNTPTSWNWTFTGGNPATSTAKNPVVTYSSAGEYSVTLNVGNSAGEDAKTVTACVVVNPAPIPPVVSFTANKTTIEKDEMVTFTDNSANTPTSWNWTFEGGTPSTSTLQNPVVTYTTSGTFDVKLTATNNDGSSSTTKVNYITVLEPVLQPVANFSASKTIVNEGGSVTFTDLSTNNPTSWNWTIEGSSPSAATSQNPTVTFNTPGTYTVTLTVGNTAGTDTKTIVDYIQVNQYIPEYCESYGNAANEWIAMIQMGSNGNSSGSTGYGDYTSKIFSLTSGESYDISLTPGFVSRSSFEYWAVWIDFNGDYDFDDAGELVFSPAKQKTTVTGTINIPADMVNIETRMRVSMGALAPSSCGNIGGGEVEDYTIIISEPVEMPPVAEFTANVTNAEVGEIIQFSDLSENNPTQWAWTFPGGNPSTSNEKNPVVSYEVAGNYDVTLEVSKPGFSSSRKVKLNYITASDFILYDYCIPHSISSASNYIKSVSIDGVINHTSSAEGYTVTEVLQTFTAGQTYVTTLIPSNSSVRNYWRIWIDFNDDSDFDDFDETILSLNNKKGAISTSITIPSYVSGASRMRLSLKASSSPSPCDDNFEGEVEDYEISVEKGVPQQAAMETSIEPENTSTILIYPNPTHNELTLLVDDINPGDSYHLFNSNGEIVLSDVIINSQTRINLSNVASGIYFMTINKKDKIFYEKVVKR